METKKTFISYSTDDSILISAIVKILRTQGKEVFLDRDCILPGEKWKAEIDKAIENSEKIIVFWCCHSNKSEWVKYEMTKALELRKVIVPIICCGFEVDPSIQDFQWIDMRGILFHHCLSHGDKIPKNVVDINIILPGTHPMPAPRNKFSNIPWKIIIYGILLLLFFIKPFPPIFGLFWAQLTNIFVILASLINLLAPILIKRSNKTRRQLEFPRFNSNGIGDIFNEIILKTEENPYMFYPSKNKNFR